MCDTTGLAYQESPSAKHCTHARPALCAVLQVEAQVAERLYAAEAAQAALQERLQQW